MVSTDAQLLGRDDVVTLLQQHLTGAERGLGAVPNAVKVIVRDGMWRERLIRQTRERAQFSTFEQFVTAPPLRGLGATLSQLRGICRDDPEALDAIDRATQHAPGRPEKTLDNVQDFPSGNASAAALRRLRKDRPDLHARVLAKELTPHGAMVEAGFRHRTVGVRLTVDGLLSQIVKLSDSDQSELYMRMGELIDAICMREPPA